MVKTKNIKQMPKLRFPEFEGEWGLQNLEHLCAKISDGIHSTPKYSDNGEFYFINGNNLIDGKVEVDDKTKRVEVSEYLKHKREIGASTILMSINGTIGNLAFYNNEKVILGKSACYINLKEITDKIFIFNTLQLESTRNFFASELTGSTIKNLSLNTIKNIAINIPSLPEQEKIASFLFAVDKKIQQLTAKKLLLEQYKKGVMQKIFSQEIRFTGNNGKDYPDWEEKKLGDILAFISTNSLSRNDLNYGSGKIKNIHYGDIHTTFKMGFVAAKEKVPYVNEEVDLRNVTKEQFCQVGDVVIADASEDYNDIGKAIEIDDLSGEKIVAGLHTFLGRDMMGQTSDGFKGYLLQVNSVRKQVQRFAQGISVLGISKTNLAKVKFQLPCKKEQIKIVAILKGLDKKIDSVESQLDQTQTFKKGLLQQMFV